MPAQLGRVSKVLAALTLLTSAPSSARAQQAYSAEAATLLGPDVAKAWVKAGAGIGWHGLADESGLYRFSEDKSQLKEPIPSFHWHFKQGQLPTLPTPKVLFAIHAFSTADAVGVRPKLVDFERFDTLRALNLAHTSVARSERAPRYKNLTELHLAKTDLSAVTYAHIASIEPLTVLDVSYNKFTQKDIEAICSLKKLRCLKLGVSNLTPDHLTCVSKLPQLQALWLDGTQLTSFDASAGFDRLQHLVLAGSLLNEDSKFVQGSRLKNLRTLDVGQTGVSDSFLQGIDLPKLTSLDIGSPYITSKSLHFPRLRKLNLNGAVIGGNELAAIATLDSLEEIHFDYAKISSFKGLERLSQLVTLTAQSTGVDDEALKYLVGLRNLRFLQLRKTKITDRGLTDRCAMNVKLFQL